MRVVVLGATGNVGSAVLPELLAAGHEVVGVSRRPPTGPPDGGSDVHWHRADVVEDDLAPVVRGADAVVHLAWQLQPSRRPQRTWRVNVGGTERVLAAVAAAGVPVVVQASSVGAYSPWDGRAPVDEAWPTDGVATLGYSREKAYVERLLDVFERDHRDVRVVRLRPGLIFQRPAASEIRRFFLGTLFPNRLARPGRVPVLPVADGIRFQAVHARDVARAYRLGVERDVRGAFNIAAEPALDLRTVAQVLGARAVPVPAPALRAAAAVTWRLRLHPVAEGWLDLAAAAPLMDTRRARDVLGWTSTVAATDALRELLAGVADRAGAGTPTLRSDEDVSRVDELGTGQGARYGLGR